MTAASIRPFRRLLGGSSGRCHPSMSSLSPLLLLLLAAACRAVLDEQRPIGGEITMTAVFTGTPTEINWKVEGDKYVDMHMELGLEPYFYRNKDRSAIDRKNGSLTIRNLTKTDSGSYKAEALVGGAYQETDVRLTVLEQVAPPTIQDLSTKLNYSYHCVSSTLGVTYTWQNSTHPTFSTNQNYSIPRKDVTEERTVTCVARNPVDEKRVSVTILPDPKPPPIWITVVVVILLLIAVLAGVGYWKRSLLMPYMMSCLPCIGSDKDRRDVESADGNGVAKQRGPQTGNDEMKTLLPQNNQKDTQPGNGEMANQPPQNNQGGTKEGNPSINVPTGTKEEPSTNNAAPPGTKEEPSTNNAAPPDVTVVTFLHNPTTLRCHFPFITGTDGLEVTWKRKNPDGGEVMVHKYKDGRDDLTDQDPKFRGHTEICKPFSEAIVALTLPGVTAEDAGTYYCQATRGKDSGEKKMTLIITGATRVTATHNDNARLCCHFPFITGAEGLEVTWWKNIKEREVLVHQYKDGQEDPPAQDPPPTQYPQFRGRTQLSEEFSEGNVELTLRNVTMDDEGSYFCRAANGKGYGEGKVQLSIR